MFLARRPYVPVNNCRAPDGLTMESRITAASSLSFLPLHISPVYSNFVFIWLLVPLLMRDPQWLELISTNKLITCFILVLIFNDDQRLMRITLLVANCFRWILKLLIESLIFCGKTYLSWDSSLFSFAWELRHKTYEKKKKCTLNVQLRRTWKRNAVIPRQLSLSIKLFLPERMYCHAELAP